MCHLAPRHLGSRRMWIREERRRETDRQDLTALHISCPESSQPGFRQAVDVTLLTKCGRKGENNFKQKGGFLLCKLVNSEYCSLSEIFAGNHRRCILGTALVWQRRQVNHSHVGLFAGLFCHCLFNMSLFSLQNLTSLCLLFVNNWARIKFPASLCSQIDKVKQSKVSFFLKTSVWELSPAADWSWQNERPTRRCVWIWNLLRMWAARWRQQDDIPQVSVPNLLPVSLIPVATFWHIPLLFFHLYLFFLLPFALWEHQFKCNVWTNN